MASTLTETYRSAPINHLPPSTKHNDQIATPTATKFATTQGSITPIKADYNPQTATSAGHLSSAHQQTSSSSQPSGLSSLAVAAMSGNRIKHEAPQMRQGQFGPMNSNNMANNGGNSFGAAPSPTGAGNNGMNNGMPTCQNCTTSTTPLWRRDEIGSVLCNACGLFLKLHGRPRPISLKTDVIKSRNRVKTSGPGQGQKKKSLFDSTQHHNNGLGDPQAQLNHGTPQPNAMQHQHQQRRPSQRSQNGHSDGSNSPISRTGTPNMYGNHMSAFNGNDLVDHQFHSQSLNGMHMGRPASPGRSETSLNDMPQTFEQLIATNSSLKTRVSELEVINELFRGRVTQLEQDEANARRGEEMRRESERNLRLHLEESQRRENQLKRRLDDLEREVAEMHEGHSMEELTHKKPRLDGTGGMDAMTEMNSLEQMAQIGEPQQQMEQQNHNDLLDPAIKDEDPLLADVLTTPDL